MYSCELFFDCHYIETGGRVLLEGWARQTSGAKRKGGRKGAGRKENKVKKNPANCNDIISMFAHARVCSCNCSSNCAFVAVRCNCAFVTVIVRFWL